MVCLVRDEHDQSVYESVYLANEYQLPADMTGWRVLDIGAHIGCFAGLAAERGAQVVAYEPAPHNYQALKHNVAGFSVLCFQVAVLAEAGEATLTLANDSAGCTLYGGQSPGAIRVRVTGFAEALFWTSPADVDLVKIDAEGAELDLVENVPADVWRRVRRLAIEFHGGYLAGAQKRAEACRARLVELGFDEVSWEATHTQRGWYRLYLGTRRSDV